MTLSTCQCTVPSLLASCEFRKRVLLCSPLPEVLQDTADAGERMSFLVMSDVFLEDESQGEGQETFPRGRVAQPPCEGRRIFHAGFSSGNFSPREQCRAQPAACCDAGTPFLTASLLVFPNGLSTLDQQELMS